MRAGGPEPSKSVRTSTDATTVAATAAVIATPRQRRCGGAASNRASGGNVGAARSSSICDSHSFTLGDLCREDQASPCRSVRHGR